VITETTDLASQVGDQIKFEEDAADRPNVCARFYRTDAWPLTSVNTLCVRLIQDGASGLTVSPEAASSTFEARTIPLIVGREFRNDGTGPAWLNHGDLS
jgi:hypothetical protein